MGNSKYFQELGGSPTRESAHFGADGDIGDGLEAAEELLESFASLIIIFVKNGI